MNIKNFFSRKEIVVPIREFFNFIEQPIYHSTLINSYQQNVLNEAIKAESLGFFNAAIIREAKEINETVQEHTNLNRVSDTQEKDLKELREIYPYKVFTKDKVDEICKVNGFYSNSAKVYSGELPKEMVTLLGLASEYRRELVHGIVYFHYQNWQDSVTGKRGIEVVNIQFKNFSELIPEHKINIGIEVRRGPYGHSTSQIIQPYYFALVTRFDFTQKSIENLNEVVILMPVLHNLNLYYLLIND